MSGLLWIALVIPLLLTGVLMAIPSLRKMTKWWEIGIPIVVTIITVLICQWVAVRSAVNDKEYWGNMAYYAVHEEPFSYDSECTESYPCGTDSKGNITYCTRWVHCVENSSRKCYLVDERGDTTYISFAKYKELDKRWEHYKGQTEQIVTKSHGYTTYGDKYKRPGHGNKHWVYWPQDKPMKSEPIVTEHTYENRLQTQSHWGKVSEKDRKLYDVFDYPSVPGGWRLSSILTNGRAFPKADMYLQYLNGYLNTPKAGYKKVRIWILLYHKQPQEAANLQRAYWKGGNKNEITIMIGTDGENITWADTMAHVDDALSQELLINIRDELLVNGMQNEPLTDDAMLKFVTWLGPMVQKKFTKPDFKQYNYIQVQPSLFTIILTYIIVLIVNIGAGFFVVLNPWDDAHSTVYYKNAYIGSQRRFRKGGRSNYRFR